MSLHVVGFQEVDEEWEKRKQIWDLCNEVGIEPPKAVLDFFEEEYPETDGRKIYLYNVLKEFKDDRINADGFELEIKKIPKNITLLRFYASW